MQFADKANSAVIPETPVMPLLQSRPFVGFVLLACASYVLAEESESYFRDAEEVSPVSAAIQSEVEPMLGEEDCCQIVGDCDQCSACGGPFGGLDYFIVGRGAGTYYSVPGETKFGGAYGLQLGVHLVGDWGFLGSFDVNHFSRGTQFSGTTGFLKLSDPCACSWWDRSTFLATFDQFGDTRIDGMYLNQLRFLLGYSVTDCLHVGAVYAQPLNEAEVEVRFRAFPAFPFRGTIAMSQAASAYAAWQVRNIQLTGSVGYRETFDELTIGSGIRVLHTERVASFAAVNYGSDRATWGASAGIEIRFGPTMSSDSCHMTDTLCGVSTSPAIVRAQSPTSLVEVVSVPGPSTGQPDTSDTYPADQFAESFIGPLPQPPTWDVFLDPQYMLFAPIQNIADIPLELKQTLPNNVLQNPGFGPFLPRTDLIPIVR